MPTRWGLNAALPAISLLVFGATNLTLAAEVQVCTDLGPFKIELLELDAPLHAANFLQYVKSGFYSGSVFHRVVNDTIVQAGGYDRRLIRRAAGEPVVNESANGQSNVRGTVAAARTEDPDSAQAQFFINLDDNNRLDGSDRQAGYTVFGRVIDGLEVLDEIGGLPTDAVAPLPGEVPDPLVVITSMTSIDEGQWEGVAAESREAFLSEQIAATEEPARTLELIDLLRSTCAVLDPDQLFLEAEAALSLGQNVRGQYVLDEYFMLADRSHSDFGSAQSLYRELAPERQTAVDPLIAHCEMPEAPAIPDGTVADLEAMTAGQDATRRFVERGEAYLDCLSEIIDEKGLTEEQESAAIQRHNATVEQLESLAEDFNEQVRAYKARED